MFKGRARRCDSAALLRWASGALENKAKMPKIPANVPPGKEGAARQLGGRGAPLTKSAETAVVMRAYGPLTSAPQTISIATRNERAAEVPGKRAALEAQGAAGRRVHRARARRCPARPSPRLLPFSPGDPTRRAATAHPAPPSPQIPVRERVSREGIKAGESAASPIAPSVTGAGGAEELLTY